MMIPLLADIPLLLAEVGVPVSGDAGLFTMASLVALVTLTTLEIVLGIDNVVFIAILADALPESQRKTARRIGLLLAMVSRIALLFAIAWLMGLTATLFEIPFMTEPHPPEGSEGPVPLGISGKDLILLGGGLFLVGKAAWEIRHQVEHTGGVEKPSGKRATFGSVVTQIVLIDMVFSLDSVITAVGMARRIEVMIAAVMIAVAVMMLAAEAISGFIRRHPTLKVLALAFLVLIGVLLIADAFHQHIDRGYVYFAMAFALAVDLIQLKVEKPKASGARGARSNTEDTA
jgi:predicted tellurium resistance membrane protein TerC